MHDNGNRSFRLQQAKMTEIIQHLLRQKIMDILYVKAANHGYLQLRKYGKMKSYTNGKTLGPPDEWKQ